MNLPTLGGCIGTKAHQREDTISLVRKYLHADDETIRKNVANVDTEDCTPKIASPQTRLLK
jgi:hypothetical protein